MEYLIVELFEVLSEFCKYNNVDVDSYINLIYDIKPIFIEAYTQGFSDCLSAYSKDINIEIEVNK